MLYIKNIDTGRLSKKLDYQQIGPFQIINSAGKQAYELKLPPYFCKLYPTFHVSLLEPFRGNTNMDSKPGLVELDGHQEWQVEKILDDRLYYRKHQYLVKWTGWPDSDNTWEPEEHVADTTALEHYLTSKNPQPTSTTNRQPKRRGKGS
jgi:hypothetical protein